MKINNRTYDSMTTWIGTGNWF